MILKSLQKTRRSTFKVKVNIKLAGKDSKEVCKDICATFIDSCRFMASILDRLASNLCYAGGIQCSKCNCDMKLVNISSKYIALLECEKCKTKKTRTWMKGC